MSEPYEELLEGEACLRLPPGARHEEICRRLHESVAASMAGVSVAKLLPLRSKIEISRFNHVCPDLALVTAAGNKLWLAAEVISSEDHSFDTVMKKGVYEQFKLPRLWMIDPRYNNVEIYHGNQYGLALKEILAIREALTEPLLPSFQLPLADLFKVSVP
jgi:Uma2 family endonuclease